MKAAGAAWALPVVRVGAAVASLGALLALIAGIGRTSLAMARNGDLPRKLAAVEPRHRVPARAELAVGAVVSVLVLTTDLRGAIGFSSFGVLTYYAIANAAAFTQTAERTALAAGAQRRRRTRLRRARRHLAALRGRRRPGRLRRRRRRSPRVRAERGRLAQRRPSLIRGSTAPVAPADAGGACSPAPPSFLWHLPPSSALTQFASARPLLDFANDRRPAASPGTPGHGVLTGSIAQTDQTWVCRGPVDLDSVSVTMTSAISSRRGADAIHLEPGCTGRIRHLEVLTAAADAVKVAEGVHDLAIDGGSIVCTAKLPTMHQDGIQVMGGDADHACAA